MRVRREHIQREASLRALGMFLMIGAVAGIATFGMFTLSRGLAWLQSIYWPLLFVSGLAPPVVFWLGWGLWRLKVQARTPLLLAASVGLMLSLAAIGASGWHILGPGAACVLIICELVSRKARFVLSSQYAEIIRQTPQIKYGELIVVNVLVLYALTFLSAIPFDPPRGGHHPHRVPASQASGP
jgi:hypothetical protein